MKFKINSLNARRALGALGVNIRMARLKRRISVKDMAERSGVSASTIMRLEKGDDGVSVGALAMVCLVLGEIDRVSDFLDPGSDDTGLLLDRENLPKRIRRKQKPTPSAFGGELIGSFPENDDEGVGF